MGIFTTTSYLIHNKFVIKVRKWNSKTIQIAVKNDWRNNPGEICKESGRNGWTVFASHPEDCSKFFICHGLRAFPIDCAEGTFFDKNLKICNHAYLVDCKNCPLKTTTETIKTIKKTTQFTTTTADLTTMTTDPTTTTTKSTT